MKKHIITSLSVAAALLSLVAVVGTVGCAGDQYHRSTGTYIDDAAVSTKVKTNLIGASDVKAGEVQVRTYQGEVQLSGFVDTPEQKDRAAEIARQVPGVRMVRNDLVIKAGTPAAAGQIQEPAGAAR